MIRPALLAWMVERDKLVVCGVGRGCFGIFVAVATLASQRQVLQHRLPIERNGNDVLYGEGFRCEIFLALAVLTNALGPLPNGTALCRNGSLPSHCGRASGRVDPSTHALTCVGIGLTRSMPVAVLHRALRFGQRWLAVHRVQHQSTLRLAACPSAWQSVHAWLRVGLD